MLLKFTTQGKFLKQFGAKGQSKGNADQVNVNRAADVFVYQKTNEAFVADGYGNRRLIVLDAETGAFKRMWGGFGKAPDTAAPSVSAGGPPARRKSTPMGRGRRNSAIRYTRSRSRTTGSSTSRTDPIAASRFSCRMANT
jgi:hypothetical protein